MGVLAENKLALGAAAVGAAAALGYLYRLRSSRSRVVRAAPTPAVPPGGPGGRIPQEGGGRLQDLQLPAGGTNERTGPGRLGARGQARPRGRPSPEHRPGTNNNPAPRMPPPGLPPSPSRRPRC